jgi:hypothetical protein
MTRSPTQILGTVAGTRWATLVAVACVTACAPTAAGPSATDGGGAAVLVEIDEDGIRAPSEVPSGNVEVTFSNSGDEPHDIFVREFDLEAGVNIVHGVFLAPGAQSQAVVHFVADATYSVGEIFGFGADAPSAQIAATGPASEDPEPETGVAVGMAEFEFSMPDTVDAGATWWELTNTGDQIHDLGIYPLADTTLDDLLADLAAVDENGQAPPEITAIPAWAVAPGETVWVRHELAAGLYAVVCRVPDDATSQDHWHLGMVREIAVED